MRERTALESAEADPTDVPLYRHSKRPRWGVALKAWQLGHKVVYQFEDGALRRFRAEYEHLFEPVEMGDAERTVAVEMLLDELSERSTEDDDATVSASAVLSRTDYVPAQVELMRDQFPGGFEDQEWRTEQRGDGADRRIKRHLLPAVEDATESLSEEHLAARVENDPASIWRDAMDLLGRTDLVTPSQLAAYKDLSDEDAATMGVALFERLYGEKSERTRFRRFARAGAKVTGERMGWSIATVIPALVQPGKEMVVRASVARSFIKLFDLDIGLPKYATYPAYRRYRRLVRALKVQLESDGLSPADLLDVHRFLRITLKNSARDRLNALVELQRQPATAA